MLMQEQFAAYEHHLQQNQQQEYDENEEEEFDENDEDCDKLSQSDFLGSNQDDEDLE